MKIALIGYGKMGKAIERIALSRGHEIVAKIDANPDDIKQLDQSSPDVVIEFTVPEMAVMNIKRCINKSIPVLSGTTGWLNNKNEVDGYCNDHNGTFFYASNYSLGVNLFFKLNEYLAKLISRYQEYNPSIEEIHHTQKKDAPSGTAITLAEGMLKYLQQKKGWKLEASDIDQIAIQSKRIDPYPGQHTVTYKSIWDNIEIRHTAHSREGFALGAVLVAEWLPGKKGVLGMNDFLSL